MGAKGYLRGHEIEFDNEKEIWYYVDTKEPTIENYETRACGCCKKTYTEEGHDGCLGTLPNVMNACCGHGIEGEAYIQFEGGDCIRGEEAIKVQKLLKSRRAM